MLLAPGNWPKQISVCSHQDQTACNVVQGVEYILVVAKDVIRQDIDSELLPSSLCSTLFFLLSEVQAEKNGTERTRPVAFEKY